MQTVVVEGSSKYAEVLELAQMLEQQAWDIRQAMQSALDDGKWYHDGVSVSRAIRKLSKAIEAVDELEPSD